MQSFQIAPLAVSAWWGGLWPCTSQKVAKNALGTFYIVGTQSLDPSGYTSTIFTLFRDKGDGTGPQPIWTETLGTNMACVEAFESGEVHVVYCNFSSGALVDFCWPDMTTSLAPNAPTVIAGFGAAGKIGTVVDDARRCIHVIGLSNNYAKISASGAFINQETLFAPTAGECPEYFSLNLDDAGSLYVAFCTALNVSPPEYPAVLACMSPNPGDLSPAWFAGSWSAGSPLTVPFNPNSTGPLVYLSMGEQARRNNNLLLGSTVSQRRMHTLMMQLPAVSERGFAYDDFRDLTTEVVSVDWGVVDALKTGHIHRPLRGPTLFPKAASGAICQRASGLYAVVHDRTNLIGLKSTDNGETWQDYAQTSILPQLGPGTDVSTWWTPRDIGISRGGEQDTSIAGVFSVMQCSPSTWANGASDFNPATSAYAFTLPAG